MLPNELPSPGMLPRSARLMTEMTNAIDYVRMVARQSPDSTAPEELRNFLRAAALLIPGKKPALPKKD